MLQSSSGLGSNVKAEVLVVDTVTEEPSMHIMFDDILGAPARRFSEYLTRIKGIKTGLMYCALMAMV